MARRNKKNIKLELVKERVCLTEILPYEIPLIFSNWNFYTFLRENKIGTQKEKIDSGLENSNIPPIVIKWLFGKSSFSKPFTFSIRHKPNQARELSIIHPKDQVKVIEFYEKYKELMIYFCSKSNFSIRKPHTIAKTIFFGDNFHRKNSSKDQGIIEVDNEEIQRMRSFFVNKKYSNIYKFYDGYEYLKSEKKYNCLYKLDIQKCFDSIYTHSIEWAIWTKDKIKQHYQGKNKRNFASEFDKLMQKMNYNETNGILIGSEFSRIFAEIILQEIEYHVERDLLEKKIYHKVDYEIFRYVDDYFIFYDDEGIVEKILNLLQARLKEFKLSISSQKTEKFNKPIITNISIAKNSLSQFLDKFLDPKIEKKDDEIISRFKIYVDRKKIITGIKSILKSNNIKYEEILNYIFSIIRKKNENILNSYKKVQKEGGETLQKEIYDAILAIIEICFFLYSVDPRINISTKLCYILNEIIKFTSHEIKSIDDKAQIKKAIYDDITAVLKKFKREEFIQSETLHLLILLREIGSDYLLDETVLHGYLKISKDKDTYSFEYQPNYLSLMTTLYYVKNAEHYSQTRELIENEILKILSNPLLKDHADNTEKCFLLFDTLSCPYIKKNVKLEIIQNMGISDNTEKHEILTYISEKLWFIQWKDFSFQKALDRKRNMAVYW